MNPSFNVVIDPLPEPLIDLTGSSPESTPEPPPIKREVVDPAPNPFKDVAPLPSKKRKLSETHSPKVAFDVPPTPASPVMMSEDAMMLGLVTSATVGAVIALVAVLAFSKVD